MIRHPKAQVLAGVLAMVASAVLVLVFAGAPALTTVALVPGVVGILLVVFGALRLAGVTEAGDAERGPEILDPPLTLLEVLRRVAVVAGAAATVIGSTVFRFLLFEDDLPIGELVAAGVVFVLGAALFARAYGAGTPIRTPQPKQADLWDRGVTWIEEHGALVGLLVLVNIVGVMYASVFLGETVGDDLTFHMAESARLADCIRAGDWDFWNPSANGGYASAYYYQVIPQLASALPAALFDHHLFWFQLSLWLPQVATPLAAYRGTRLVGATPWQAGFAAFAVTFVSGASRWGTGADGTFQVGLYTQTWALAAFPLGLGHGVRWLTEGKSLAPAVAWGGFVFLCHPFASIGLCLGLAVGVLAHYLLQPAPRRAGLARVLLTAILGIALVATLVALWLDPLTHDAAGKAIAGYRPKLYYVAAAILFAGLLARVATRGRLLRMLLLAGTVLALLANVIGFAMIEVVPKRPEGATTDLPPEWQLGAASLYIGPIVILLAIAGRLVLSMRARENIDETSSPDRSNATRLLALVGYLMVALAVFGVLVWKVHPVAGVAAGVILLGGFAWLAWPVRDEPLVRLIPLGVLLAIATAPGWLPLIVDRDGFGGFPHRVADEVGPGYQELMKWYSHGSILDHGRWVLMTYALPIVLFARAGGRPFARWLWAPALTFAALLALGPHMPKTADDLLPAVRFLGAMQVVLALGIGAGMYAIGSTIWNMRAGGLLFGAVRAITGKRPDPDVQYGVRTAVLAVGAALVVFVGLMGSNRLSARVNTLQAYDYRPEMIQMIDLIERQPQGRKQVGPGCENHWWNLLSYVYARRPALLQMGGGGLQASPNYDFLWSVRDFPKLAWVYDTPLFLFEKAKGASAPDGEMLGETKRYELRRLPAPGPVSPIRITGVLPEGESRAGSPVRVAAIDWLKSAAPLSNEHLAYHGHGAAGPAPDARVVRAFHVDPSPGDTADLYAEVDVTSPTTFVARESWHPRWHAYVDGVEVPVRRVTPDFPAIDVAPGQHVLAFRFERPWWAQGVWLAWPGATLLAWRFARRRRRRGELPRATARVV